MTGIEEMVKNTWAGCCRNTACDEHGQRRRRRCWGLTGIAHTKRDYLEETEAWECLGLNLSIGPRTVQWPLSAKLEVEAHAAESSEVGYLHWLDRDDSGCCMCFRFDGIAADWTRQAKTRLSCIE